MYKLTMKQENFCVHYVETGNKTEAYRRSYSTARMEPLTINKRASELSKTPKVIARVNELNRLTVDNYTKDRAVYLPLDVFNEASKLCDSNQSVSKWCEMVLRRAINENAGSIQRVLRRANVDPTTRYALLNRAGFKCQACGSKPQPNNNVELVVDHIVPFSMGGLDHEANMQILCYKCNASKGNRFAVDHNTPTDGGRYGKD